MVLSRALCVLLAAAGCGQSLFDAHGRRDGGPGGGDDDGGGGGGDGSVPMACPADACLADAAADFNNAQGGVNGHWYYLEDKRNRTWVSMTPDPGGMVGAELGNRIGPCGDSSAAGCRALPGALLVSSSAMTADPAIEYRSFEAKVMRLALRVHVDGGAQRVRLYRNSREDVLFTAIGAPGDTVEATVTVDALVNDKFLVALEPTAGAAGTAALHFFVIDAKTTFPQTCQLAIPFTSLGKSQYTVADLCGNTDIQSRLDDANSAPGFRDDPFGKASAAAYFEPGLNYRGVRTLPRDRPVTVQFWALHDNPPPYTIGWLFSDIDQVNGGGLGVRFNFTSPIKLEAAVIASSTYSFLGVSYASTDPTGWHFVRVVHTSSGISICLDGTRLGMFPAPGPLASNEPPNLGRNGRWDTSNTLYGGMDDVRMFSEALPCN
jgi:hypothetical protein